MLNYKLNLKKIKKVGIVKQGFVLITKREYSYYSVFIHLFKNAGQYSLKGINFALDNKNFVIFMYGGLKAIKLSGIKNIFKTGSISGVGLEGSKILKETLVNEEIVKESLISQAGNALKNGVYNYMPKRVPNEIIKDNLEIVELGKNSLEIAKEISIPILETAIITGAANKVIESVVTENGVEIISKPVKEAVKSTLVENVLNESAAAILTGVSGIGMVGIGLGLLNSLTDEVMDKKIEAGGNAFNRIVNDESVEKAAKHSFKTFLNLMGYGIAACIKESEVTGIEVATISIGMVLVCTGSYYIAKGTYKYIKS